MGVLFYLLVSGKVPFEGKVFSEVVKRIKSCDVRFHDEARIPEDICMVIDTIFMYE